MYNCCSTSINSNGSLAERGEKTGVVRLAFFLIDGQSQSREIFTTPVS